MHDNSASAKSADDNWATTTRLSQSRLLTNSAKSKSAIAIPSERILSSPIEDDDRLSEVLRKYIHRATGSAQGPAFPARNVEPAPQTG